MPRIRYVGGFAEADVVLVGLTVKRGETFDATDEQAAVLLLAPDNYELAPPIAKGGITEKHKRTVVVGEAGPEAVIPLAKAPAKADPAQEG